MQLVHPIANVRLPVVDLCGLPADQRQLEALRLAAEDARQPFDLSGYPLLRAKLVQLGDTEHRLLITCTRSFQTAFRYTEFPPPELVALYEALHDW